MFRAALRQTLARDENRAPTRETSHLKHQIIYVLPGATDSKRNFLVGIWFPSLVPNAHAPDPYLKSALFLIDEPDIYLHSDLQRQLLGLVYRRCAFFTSQENLFFGLTLTAFRNGLYSYHPTHRGRCHEASWWRSGCGARACASHAQVPGGLGSPSAPTTGGRPSRAGRDRTSGAKAPRWAGEEPAVRVPEARSRGPKIAAVERREATRPRATGARAARRRLDETAPLGAPPPHLSGALLPGRQRKARPAPLNIPGLANAVSEKPQPKNRMPRTTLSPKQQFDFNACGRKTGAAGKSGGDIECRGGFRCGRSTLLLCLALAGCAGAQCRSGALHRIDCAAAGAVSAARRAFAARPRRASLRQEERRLVEGRRRHPREDQRHVLDEIRDRPQGYAGRQARRPGQRLRRPDAEGASGPLGR